MLLYTYAIGHVESDLAHPSYFLHVESQCVQQEENLHLYSPSIYIQSGSRW